MPLKVQLLRILDRFLAASPWLIFLLLDNSLLRRVFLDKYLRNRPEMFLAYYQWKPVIWRKKHILILKTDAIGDYLLFRNYLEEMAAHFRPLGYRIVLAGNLAWKELAMALDSEFADEFIWLNRGGMNRKPDQDKQIDFLAQINRHSYQKLLYPNFSREWEAGDWLAKHIPSKEKFAFDGNVVNQTEKQHKQGNLIYSKLISPEIPYMFDFERNGEIVSRFTGEKSRLSSPRITVPAGQNKQQSYAVFFPGASFESRRWPADRFSELGELIYKQLEMPVVLAGGPGEVELCERIADKYPAVFSNQAGKTTLPELLELIAGAGLLVSNDTSAIHMGVQCGIPSVCIYKGNNYGRCMPYPDKMMPGFQICMPPDLLHVPEEDRYRLFSESDGLSIDKIDTTAAWNCVLLLKSKAQLS
jgi:ADP-heptose:LPS heptosyltransferase